MPLNSSITEEPAHQALITFRAPLAMVMPKGRMRERLGLVLPAVVQFHISIGLSSSWVSRLLWKAVMGRCSLLKRKP